LFFDLAETPGVLDSWLQWTDSVDEAMTSAVAVVPFPDVAGVPQEMRGKHVAQLQISYCGPTERGRELLAPLRAIRGVLRDTVRELPYADSGSVFDEPAEPHGYRGNTALLDRLDSGDLARLVGQVGPASRSPHVVSVRHLGGALARKPDTPSAVGHRGAAYSLGLLAAVDPAAANQTHLPRRGLLAPFSDHILGPSLNFSFGPIEEHDIRAAFEQADYRRL